jgi:hypothetical protein
VTGIGTVGTVVALVWATAAAGCAKSNPVYGASSTEGSTTMADSTSASSGTTEGLSTTSATGTSTSSATAGSSTGCDTDCGEGGGVVAQYVEGDDDTAEQFIGLGVVDVDPPQVVVSGRDTKLTGSPVIAFDGDLVETGRVEVHPEGFNGSRVWAVSQFGNEIYLVGTAFSDGPTTPFLQRVTISPQGVPIPASGGATTLALQAGRPEAVVRRPNPGADGIVIGGWTMTSPKGGILGVVGENDNAVEYDLPYYDVMLRSVEFFDITVVSDTVYLAGLVGEEALLGSFSEATGFVPLANFESPNEVAKLQAVQGQSDSLVIGGYIGAERDAYLSRITLQGEVTWEREWLANGASEVEAIDVDEAGNVVAVGFWQEQPASPMSPWAAKLSFDGTELWSRVYTSEFPAPAAFRDVVARQDGIFVSGEAADGMAGTDGLVARLAP